jgi:peroxiredoxin
MWHVGSHEFDTRTTDPSGSINQARAELPAPRLEEGFDPMTTLHTRRALGLGAAALLAAALALPAAGRDPVQPGKPAPEFTAKDAAGRDVKLSSYKGKIVVLEWTNHDCPYVKKHYGTGNMQSLQKEAVDQGVVWLTIASSQPGAQGHVNGLEAERLTAERKASPSVFLLDPEGRVGRAYGATATPHMYVIDKAGMLAYMGAIDDKPSTNSADVKGARNYVREAIGAIAAGQPVKTASTRVYGCAIKYQEPRS